MARNPHRSVNYRQSSVNSDMFPMIRYCILPGTVQYGTVLTYSHSLKMILERVALTGKTQKPDRKIETRKGYEEYFLCSPASMFLRGLSNLF